MKTLRLECECTLDLISDNNQGCIGGHCDTCPHMQFQLWDGNIKIATVDYEGLREAMTFVNITR